MVLEHFIRELSLNVGQLSCQNSRSRIPEYVSAMAAHSVGYQLSVDSGVCGAASSSAGGCRAS